MTMRRVDKKLRAAVVSRAKEACENCLRWVGNDGHFDHAFGRAKAPESLETCWYLCVPCDHAKTTNSPSAAVWLERFIEHCLFRGYTESAERATIKIEVLRAKKLTT